MNRENTTGPAFFGRWSQPAALVNAGLVPPDLFPLEKLLFCARCGQQFIGTHRTTGTGLADSTPATDSALQPGRRVSGTHLISTRDADGTHLAGPADQPGPGAHVRGDAGQPGCTCSPDGTHATGGTYFVGPEDFPDGDEYAEDPRVYGTFCTCRPRPLEAFRVELEVYSETHLHAFDTPEPVPGLTKAHYAVLAIRFFTRVEVGPTADHMTFTPRI